MSALDDLDATASGIQVDVALRSNFESGDEFVLTVTDSSNAVAQFEAIADGSGSVVFDNVTLPAGELSLEATGSSNCGTGSDTAELVVLTASDCGLTIVEGPIENSFYAPIPVLNSGNDSNSDLPNFQSKIEIQTGDGFDVEVFVLDTDSGVEASVGVATTDTTGLASFDVTLAQGLQAVRATCTRGGANEASATNTVFVDTVVPSCSLESPVDGVTVTPNDDEQGSVVDGIQMRWRGSVDDDAENDTEGERAAFFRDALEFPGTTINEAGETQSDGLAEFTAPGSFAVSVSTQDHAGNACSAGHDVNVIMDGCSITFSEPSAIVVADSNGTAADGLQVDVVLAVGTECAGETAFVDCGSGELSAVVPSDGRTSIPGVTLNNDSTSQGQINCTARVVNSENFETSDTRLVTWDTQAPGSILFITSPPGLSCGDSVVFNVANDLDSNLSNGFQIEVQPLASDEETLDLQITNSAGTTTSSDVSETPQPVTLLLGSNDLQVIATDTVGNVSTSGACIITVADLVITIDDPAGSGILSSLDGTVNASDELELTICGTVSLDTVDLTLTVGASVFATTVAAGSWCTDNPVELVEGVHLLEVDAASTVDARVGELDMTVAVDITPPASPSGLTVTSPNHQEIDASWDAVAGADRFVLRFSTAAFLDFPNDGVEVAGVDGSLSATISQLLAGQEYFVALASVDVNGNMSAPTLAAGVTPAYDQSGAIEPPLAAGDGVLKQFGAQIAGGDFDNDGFSDVAVSAPFQTSAAGAGSGIVYIYFGSSMGLSTSAGVTIESTDTNGHLGDGLTRISWNTNGEDDLAMSAWNSNVVYIYRNADIAASKLSGAAPSPEVTIRPAIGSWFEPVGGAFPGFGSHLAAGQIDAAGTMEDLIIGVPFGGATANGGAAIVYGGVPTASTVALSEAAGQVAGMSGLVGRYFESGQGFSSLGQFVSYLGDTRAGGGVGDLALGALTEFEGADHRVIVLRGRAAPTPGSAMQLITFDGASDLEVVLTGSAGTSTAFGESVASIAGTGGSALRDIVISSALEDTETGHLYIIDGGITGTHNIVDSTDYLARISGDATGARFGGAVANNALFGGNDINGDGVEDLVVAAGRTVNLGVYTWYGDSIVAGNSVASSRDYFVLRPVGFSNSFDSGSKLPLAASWIGDVNGDGLDDICWGDAKFLNQGVDLGSPADDTDDEGRIEILSDDGI
ncbi:MAG: hypothetical protein GY811_26975 [Myxococcales bacterium]|nr:hypothetical protein [Myxococcales bacterium]